MTRPLSLSTQVLIALSRHHGRENGIRADILARQLNCEPRTLRNAISKLREDGIAICGLPGMGYFMPLTADELDEACKFLEHRALKSLRLLSRMKKVALPTLLGQLRLNQA